MKISPLMPVVLIAIVLFAVACAPRADIIQAGAEATLTALIPTSMLEDDRPTGTPIPTLLAPSETPGPTATPIVDVVEPPTPEISPTPTLVSATTILFEDNFDLPRDWGAGETADAIVSIEPVGTLRFVQKTSGRFSVRVTGRTADDFYSTLSSQLASPCRPGDRHGLMFRVQDVGNYYVFLIDCQQRHRVARVVDGGFNYLYDWTFDEAINGGNDAANLLGVIADGPDLRFVVNDQQVSSLQDSTFLEGVFGIWLGAETSTNYTVLFDQWIIYSLDP